MTRRGAWLIAGQVGIVVVLSVLVYQTLLKPDDDHRPFAVKAPAQVAPDTGRDAASGGVRADPGRRSPSEDGGPAPTPGLTAHAQLGPAPSPPRSETSSEAAQSPADEQYADTVARLFTRL